MTSLAEEMRTSVGIVPYLESQHWTYSTNLN
jgi:NADH pyrophosphatase NudC (nudix superfamily)